MLLNWLATRNFVISVFFLLPLIMFLKFLAQPKKAEKMANTGNQVIEDTPKLMVKNGY